MMHFDRAVREIHSHEETTRVELRRIDRLPPYVFSIVNEMKAEARRRGEDIIDLGMGNPDLPTPQPIVDKLTPVSYTHLRAHETRHDLVCRLLLEKKKK